MNRLLPLILLLVAAFGVFLWRGLPQAARVQRAWGELRLREQELQATQRTVDLVTYDEFLELTARHERAADQLEQRWALLTDRAVDAPPTPPLAALLADSQLSGLRRPSPLADALLRAGESSATAAQSLAAILRALPEAEGLVVDELALRDEGRPHGVPGESALQDVEAQLVVTGALADVTSVLERLSPERGAGLPIVSVRSASLRRIEPERWGSGVHRLSSPPVRLSATLSILFATEEAPR